MEKNIMSNVEVQNPRLPKFGQALGPDAGISSDVYEAYAPQMAMTDFQTDFSRTGYLMGRDIEKEKQAQLDAQIAQSKFAQAERERGAEKEAKKAKKSSKVKSAATWGTAGAQVGGPVGALIGGGLGYLFGNEGGYVPEIHPRSMLFKEYQQGGSVRGYTGEGKFLQRGLQNLQFRQEDIDRLSKNVDKMGKYGFWDAAMDVGQGYTMGKSMAGGVKNVMTGLKDWKQFGLKDAIKHYAARAGGLGDVGTILEEFGGFDKEDFLTKAQDVFKENVRALGEEQNPFLEMTDEQSDKQFWSDENLSDKRVGPSAAIKKMVTSQAKKGADLDYINRLAAAQRATAMQQSANLQSDPAALQKRRANLKRAHMSMIGTPASVDRAPVRDTALGKGGFKKAFRDARNKGLNVFDYQGKMYNTELA
tara:strand:+ start:1109 stop:2365 length:1257 start_codon:yes stop_codon:yes gene_type:complete